MQEKMQLQALLSQLQQQIQAQTKSLKDQFGIVATASSNHQTTTFLGNAMDSRRLSSVNLNNVNATVGNDVPMAMVQQYAQPSSPQAISQHHQQQQQQMQMHFQMMQEQQQQQQQQLHFVQAQQQQQNPMMSVLPISLSNQNRMQPNLITRMQIQNQIQQHQRSNIGNDESTPVGGPFSMQISPQTPSLYPPQQVPAPLQFQPQMQYNHLGNQQLHLHHQQQQQIHDMASNSVYPEISPTTTNDSNNMNST
jgi:hypothetical protein